VFWPYRPRQGYPSAPAWLVLLAILGAVVLFFAVPIVLAEALYHLGLLPIPTPS
jgi:hypothetical protein